MRKIVLSVSVALLLVFDLEAVSRIPNEVLRRLNLGPNSPSPSDVAQNHGYQADTHDVTTPDGYILNVQRIRNKTVQISEPIVLVHCITCNAGIWMLQEPPNNIVFLLADAGYDVWLPSLRGSQFSRKHNRLSPHSAEFWDFGWHEHGVLDMPSVIDHILNETHSKQVHYVGYSMGTTTFFVMTSMLPEYNAKIKHMYALTPVAYCGNVRSVIRLFAPGIRFWNNLMEALLRNHVPLEMELIKVIKELFCTYVSRNVCLYINDAIMGHNPTRNEGAMTSFLLYYPDAASAKQLTHYAQLINHPYTFRLFDYGEENWERYNSSVPPAYPIHNIKTPMTFFYSKNDALGALEDVEEFSKKLHNVTLYLVEDPKYNHLDYVLSASVNEEINMPLLKMLQSHLRR